MATKETTQDQQALPKKHNSLLVTAPQALGAQRKSLVCRWSIESEDQTNDTTSWTISGSTFLLYLYCRVRDITKEVKNDKIISKPAAAFQIW